jgi:hypothetical protein
MSQEAFVQKIDEAIYIEDEMIQAILSLLDKQTDFFDHNPDAKKIVDILLDDTKKHKKIFEDIINKRV